MDDFSAFVPNVTFELIPINNLVSDQAYQRNLSEAHIERTVEEFDIYQVNPVKVSRRNGINFVVNGQHTVEILALASGTRNVPCWCMVFNEELSYKKEATIFSLQQKHIKPLLPYEIFMANIEAGKNEQLTILALVQSYGLRLAPTKAPGAICAVSTLENIYRKYRRQGIASALTSQLAIQILKRGKVPFYCAAWCNVKSVRNAIKSGFRPAWVEMTAKSTDTVNSMIQI